MKSSLWLIKSEPNEYSWDNLKLDEETVWDGIKAPLALRNLGMMKLNDSAFFYHTGKERLIVGIVNISSLPYPDPGADDPRRLVVKIKRERELRNPVTLKQIKESGLFPEWELVRQPRLSVMPVSKEQWDKIIAWSEKG